METSRALTEGSVPLPLNKNAKYKQWIGSWNCVKPGTCSLLMFSFFSLFWCFFLSSSFLHLLVTPTLCITNDGKGCLCICICFFFMSRSARDINFKEDFYPCFHVSLRTGAQCSASGVEPHLCATVALYPLYDAVSWKVRGVCWWVHRTR